MSPSLKDAATEEPFDEFLGLKLRRVVMAPRQEGSVQVLAVELYDDGVIARFLLYEREERSELAQALGGEPEGRLSFRLSDDLDTTYRWTRTGSTLMLPKTDRGQSPPRAGKPIIRGDAVFVPAVPDDARQLTVVTVEALVEIPLEETPEPDRL